MILQYSKIKCRTLQPISNPTQTSRQKLNFTGKNSKIAFGGLSSISTNCRLPISTIFDHALSGEYTVHLWLAGKRVVDFLLVWIELFHQLSQLWDHIRYERILVEIVVFERVLGHFERKFQGEGGRPLTTLGVRKLESMGYDVFVILPLDVLIQYRRVTDRQTHRHWQTHTHTDTRRWLVHLP